MTNERANLFIKRAEMIGIFDMHPEFTRLSKEKRLEMAKKIDEKDLNPIIIDFLNMSNFRFKIAKPVIKHQIKKYCAPEFRKIVF